MRRAGCSLLLIALAACGTPARPTQVTPIAAPADAAVAPADAMPTALVSIAGARTRAIESPHGGEIVTLAATADGAAAITSDRHGGVRLWPALDGTREPVVVDVPPPRILALGPAPRGFLVALIDQVGGLVLQVVDRDGLTLQRAVLAADPGFGGVVMTADGPLAWRADEVLVRMSADGARSAELAAEPGQRILTVALAGARAIAVIESGSPVRRRARWLTLGRTLAWGDWLDVGTDIGPVIAVSPSGTRLAYLVGDHTSAADLVVVDTRSGTVLASQRTASQASLGFVDDDHLALATPGRIAWVDVSVSKVASASNRQTGGDPSDPRIVAIGGGHAIGAASGSLILSPSPASGRPVSFLGYDLETPTVVAPGAGGQLLVSGRGKLALLDRELRSVAAPELGIPAGAAVGTLRWVAGDAWLVQYARLLDGQTALALADARTGRATTLRTKLPVLHQLGYEPSTQLVTLSLGERSEIAKLDVERARLASAGRLARGSRYEQVVFAPVAPSLAGGVQVVVVRMLDRMTVRWVTDPAHPERGASVTLDGSLATTDRAGHVYVWQNGPGGLELVVYRDGKRVRGMPSDGPSAVFPDARGERAIVLQRRGVAMRGADGAQVWAQPLSSVTEAVWADDDTIVLVTHNGLARLSAATGALVAARCGWRFGLTKAPPPLAGNTEPVCAQLR